MSRITLFNIFYNVFTQPRPQSNFKKIVLAPQDFAGNLYLI